MNGSYELNNEKISEVITTTSGGAYILSRNGINAHYVGRSDSDVATRLGVWVNDKSNYTHFWFEYADSPKAAFELECQWWHKYNPTDNKIHPDRPENSNWECPICNIFGKRWGW